MRLPDAPGGVPAHELVISGALGLIMGVLGFYITRAIGPRVAEAVRTVGL